MATSHAGRRMINYVNACKLQREILRKCKTLSKCRCFHVIYVARHFRHEVSGRDAGFGKDVRIKYMSIMERTSLAILLIQACIEAVEACTEATFPQQIYLSVCLSIRCVVRIATSACMGLIWPKKATHAHFWLTADSTFVSVSDRYPDDY